MHQWVFHEKVTLVISLLLFVLVSSLLRWKLEKLPIFLEAPVKQSGPQNRRDCVFCVWGQSRRRSSLAGELGLSATEDWIRSISWKYFLKARKLELSATAANICQFSRIRIGKCLLQDIFKFSCDKRECEKLKL